MQFDDVRQGMLQGCAAAEEAPAGSASTASRPARVMTLQVVRSRIASVGIVSTCTVCIGHGAACLPQRAQLERMLHSCKVQVACTSTMASTGMQHAVQEVHIFIP